MTKKEINNMQSVLDALTRGENVFFKKKGKNEPYDIFYGNNLNFIDFDYKTKEELNKKQEGFKSEIKLGACFVYFADLKQNRVSHPAIFKIAKLEEENEIVQIELRQSSYTREAEFEVRLSFDELEQSFLSVKDEKLLWFFECLENEKGQSHLSECRMNFLKTYYDKQEGVYTDAIAQFHLGCFFKTD